MSNNKKKFLIFCYTGLGNLVLKMPFLKSIKNIYPNSEINLITGGNYTFQVDQEFFLVKQNLINNVIILNENENILTLYKKLKKISKHNYDGIFLPFAGMSRKIKYLIFLFRCRKVINYIIRDNQLLSDYFKLIPFLFFKQIKLVKVKANRHEVYLNLDLLDSFVKNKKDFYCKDLFFEEKYIVNTNIVRKLYLKRNNYIIIQPTAADGTMRMKIWHPENFLKLINELSVRFKKYKIILLGNKNDLISSEKYFKPTSDQYLNLMGTTNINELIELIMKCRLVISHDSSVMHIASAFNKPLISLLGPSDIKRTGPLGKNSIELISRTKYTFARENFKYTEEELSKKSENYELMSNISVMQVLDSFEKMEEEILDKIYLKD